MAVLQPSIIYLVQDNRLRPGDRQRDVRQDAYEFFCCRLCAACTACAWTAPMLAAYATMSEAFAYASAAVTRVGRCWCIAKCPAAHTPAA
jgi:hypothetical protein